MNWTVYFFTYENLYFKFLLYSFKMRFKICLLFHCLIFLACSSDSLNFASLNSLIRWTLSLSFDGCTNIIVLVWCNRIQNIRFSHIHFIELFLGHFNNQYETTPIKYKILSAYMKSLPVKWKRFIREIECLMFSFLIFHTTILKPNLNMIKIKNLSNHRQWKFTFTWFSSNCKDVAISMRLARVK
jgi:hypothetical protein